MQSLPLSRGTDITSKRPGINHNGVEAALQVTSVSCGDSHTLFLCMDGAVLGCGEASEGQLPCSKHEFSPVQSALDCGSGGAGLLDALPPRLVCAVPRHLRLPFLNARASV